MDPELHQHGSAEPHSDTAASEALANERNIAAFAHLLGILTWFLGALVIWVISERSSFSDDQAREALNFQITIGLGYVGVAILTCATMGLTAWLTSVVWLVNVVFCIIAAVAASRSKLYRYPVSLRLIS